MNRRASWRDVLDRLHEEDDLFPPAALMSNVARHYDKNAAQLLASPDKAVLLAMLDRLIDGREVLNRKPPHRAVEGGYGKSFGRVTVADKARFVLAELLGKELAAEAIAAGSPWFAANHARLEWDTATKRFVRV